VGGPPDAVPPLDPDAETKDLRATGKPALGRRIAVAGLVALLLVSIAILVRVLLS
jgi:hypothetical protein